MHPLLDLSPLFGALRAGDREAFDELFALFYDHLHDQAHRQLARGRPGDTLNTTALVHELYLKLGVGSSFAFQDGNHFFAVAAKAMRQVIVDFARRHAAQIRGGRAQHVPLDAVQIPLKTGAAELLAMDEALSRLERLSPRLGQVVELHYFGGLPIGDVAEVMGYSSRTVKRDWQKARAFLLEALQ